MIVYGRIPLDYVSEKLGAELVPPCQAIGLMRDGKVVAAGVFNHWTGYDAHFSVASEPGGITRDLLRAWGRYGKETLGLGRITFVTEQPLVIDMAKRLGAVEEGRMRDHFGRGRDGVVLGVLKADWRF